MKKNLLFVVLLCVVTILPAQEKDAWLLEGGITFNHFQQQVKAEVGDPRGERLINIFELGAHAAATWKWKDYLAFGLFMRIDRGQRNMASFAGFDDEGKTTVTNEIGGTYWEFWAGPLVQAFWRQFSLELGYGLIGLRKDLGRGDIPNQSGETGGVFSLNPQVAWLVNLGGYIPINKQWDVALKLEYRGRYYLERGGEKLINNIDHGTQSVVPVLGVRYKL